MHTVVSKSNPGGDRLLFLHIVLQKWKPKVDKNAIRCNQKVATALCTNLEFMGMISIHTKISLSFLMLISDRIPGTLQPLPLCIYNPSNKKNKEFYVGIHTVGHKSQVSKTWQMSQLQSFVTEFLKRLLLVRCLNNYLIFYFLIVT